MRASPNALPSAPSFSHDRPSGRDQAEAALDVAWPRRPDEPELAVGAQEQDVRERVRVDRLVAGRAASRSPTASSTQADPALEVELHHEVPEPPEHLRAEHGVVAGLLERLLAQLDRLGARARGSSG